MNQNAKHPKLLPSPNLRAKQTQVPCGGMSFLFAIYILPSFHAFHAFPAFHAFLHSFFSSLHSSIRQPCILRPFLKWHLSYLIRPRKTNRKGKHRKPKSNLQQPTTKPKDPNAGSSEENSDDEYFYPPTRIAEADEYVFTTIFLLFLFPS
jgi:hypothetical protein